MAKDSNKAQEEEEEPATNMSRVLALFWGSTKNTDCI